MKDECFETRHKGLHYAVHGPAGRPLILLHGVVRRWQTFLPLFPLLGLRWHLHGLDFRGHGESAKAGSYLVNDYVADALTLLREVVREPAVVYGHSLGAMVAAAVAAAAPALVRAIVMEDPPFQTMGSRIAETPFLSFFAAIEQFAGDQSPLPDLVRRLGDQQVLTTDRSRLAGIRELRDPVSLRFTAAALQRIEPAVLRPIVEGRWLEGYDMQSIFEGIECPVLLFGAGPNAGGMLTGEDAQTALHLIRDCSLIRYPDSGHVLHWAQTAALSQAVSAFLETLP